MKQIFLILSLAWIFTSAFAQNIPPKPEPARLVNDFAGIISNTSSLEDSLLRFEARTTTQIVVVTMPTLDGAPVSDFAILLGEKWGVGQRDKDNGIVILVKPKSQSENGEAFIATGYGVEGALPDVMCSQIVEKIMIPYFQNDDYSGGILAGAIAVMKATDDEYTADDKLPESGSSFWEVILCIIIIFVLKFFFGIPIFGGGYSSGSNWSSFSGGSGSFGGFGGGSFGGGGGGGRW